MVAGKIEYIIMLIKLLAKHLRDNDIHNIMDYNDKLVYPDKIRVNLYYLSHYSFFKDLEMIVCTVLGRKMMYGGEWI